MRKHLIFVVLSLLVALTVGAVSAQDDVTLVVWDNWTRPAEQAMIDTLTSEFEAANPGVTVVRESYDTSELQNILSLALTEPTGPDVAMVNQGIANMGSLVAAGLLLPVTDYAEQYDWASRYGESLHLRNSFSEDGTQLGVGDLYGVSVTAEVVGVFYHKAVFAEHGLEVPTTLAEFEALAEALVAAGVTPIAFGSLDGWPAIHEYGAIQNAYTTTDALDNLIFRYEDGTFDDEANLTAAQKLVEWVNNGYFSPGFEGMDYDNATTTAFVNGDAAMWLTGSWVSGTITAAGIDETEVGFFLLPDEAGSEVPVATGGVGLAYSVRATSENADLAAAYIDYVTGDRSAELLFAEGFLPAVAVDEADLTPDTMTADIVNAWNAISADNKVGHYLDWTIPADDLVAELQALLAGVVSPEDFVANVQASFESSAP